MKCLFFLFVLAFGVGTFILADAEKTTSKLNESSKATLSKSQINLSLLANQTEKAVLKAIDKVVEKTHQLKNILKEKRPILDKKLIELFPQLKVQIELAIKFDDNLVACYDKSIGTNKTIDIFQEKLHVIVHKFFSEHIKLILNEDLHHVVSNFIKNLKSLVKNIIKCVKEKDLNKRTKVGITPLMIYSYKEFLGEILNQNLKSKNTTFLGEEHNLNNPSAPECSLETRANETETLPESFSWLEQGYVSPVYNQGKCKSCYVFSSMSGLESQYMIHNNKKPIHLSYQAMLNCMIPKNGYHSTGCLGGLIFEPMDRMISHGVSLESVATYNAKQTECQVFPVELKADNYCYYEKLKTENIQRLVMRNGPAVVGIDSKDELLSSIKGPYHGKCTPNIDHAVLLVGWNPDYWIIKNSWSEDWGINGYLWLPRNPENNCGINEIFAQPILYGESKSPEEQPEPSQTESPEESQKDEVEEFENDFDF